MYNTKVGTLFYLRLSWVCRHDSEKELWKDLQIVIGEVV